MRGTGAGAPSSDRRPGSPTPAQWPGGAAGDGVDGSGRGRGVGWGVSGGGVSKVAVEDVSVGSNEGDWGGCTAPSTVSRLITGSVGVSGLGCPVAGASSSGLAVTAAGTETG